MAIKKIFIKRSRDVHADEVMTAQLARLSAMATGSCLWLSVTVMSGSHVLFGSKIVSCSSAETFGNLSRVLEEKFAERRVDIVNIDNGKCTHEVPLDAPLTVAVDFSCRNIVFHLAVDTVESSSSTMRNAFDVLMTSQRRILLPQKVIGESLRADQMLRNDVIDLLASMNVGWSLDMVGVVGERSVKAMVSAL